MATSGLDIKKRIALFEKEKALSTSSQAAPFHPPVKPKPPPPPNRPKQDVSRTRQTNPPVPKRSPQSGDIQEPADAKTVVKLGELPRKVDGKVSNTRQTNSEVPKLSLQSRDAQEPEVSSAEQTDPPVPKRSPKSRDVKEPADTKTESKLPPPPTVKVTELSNKTDGKDTKTQSNLPPPPPAPIVRRGELSSEPDNKAATPQSATSPPPVPPRKITNETGAERQPRSSAGKRTDYMNITVQKNQGSIGKCEDVLLRQKDNDSMITVVGFDKNVTEDGLKLHFENPKRSGGGPVDSVSIIDGAAVVHFQHASDAERVLKKRQLHQRQFLTVASFTNSVISNVFVLSGMSKSTSREHLKEFLESRTNSSVESMVDVKEDHILVTFHESSAPDYGHLKSVLRDERLNSCYLNVTQHHLTNNLYDEPCDELAIPATVEKFRFFQNYKLKESSDQMEEYPVIFTMDSHEYQIVLQGRTSDVSDAGKFIKEMLSTFSVSKNNIVRPGIYTFLQSKEALEMISKLETDEECTIFVQEDIYEHVDVLDESDSAISTDTDSNPSGGSFKTLVLPDTPRDPSTTEQLTGGNQSEENCCVIMKSGVLSHFKIGRCQFLMKEGNVDTEESDCIVNITESEIDQGDVWKYLKESTQNDLIKQFTLRESEWVKKGIVTSTVMGHPYRYIIHVTLQHFGGDMRKAVSKTLHVANTMRGVNSVLFFSTGTDDYNHSRAEALPRVFVEVINKFQKTSQLQLADVRLVFDKMAKSFITSAQQQVETIREKKKTKFWNAVSNPFKTKGTTHVTTTPLPSASNISKESQGPEETGVSDDEDDNTLYSDDAVIFICSLSEATNQKVFDKLDKLCQQHMPAKVVRDQRIGGLTKRQLKEIRKTAAKRVEVRADMDECCIEINGFSNDVDRVYLKLKRLLDTLPDIDGNVSNDGTSEKLKPPHRQRVRRQTSAAASVTTNQTIPDTRHEDRDDTFGRHVASELRAISDEDKKRKAKLEIQKILFEAQS